MKTDSICITVAIPAYNCEKYIGICIDSILTQTYSNFELILVDDGSTDSTPTLCDQYAKKDNRIRVIHQKNGGAAAARNTAIKAAIGAYITFVDSDDYLDADYLQAMVSVAQKTQADLIASGLKMETWEKDICVKSVEYAFSEEKEYSVKDILEDWNVTFPAICMCGPCCKFYKRALIEEGAVSFPVDLHCGEDTTFNLNYLKMCNNVYAVKQSYYHYRRGNEESLFSRFHKDTYEIHRRVYTKQWELMMNCGCSPVSMAAFRRGYFSMLLGGVHEYYRFYEKTTTEEKRQLFEKIATDPFVAKTKIKELKGKNKLFLILFKMKQYAIIRWLFDRHYKK